jgi:hypothetical protein
MLADGAPFGGILAVTLALVFGDLMVSTQKL